MAADRRANCEMTDWKGRAVHGIIIISFHDRGYNRLQSNNINHDLREIDYTGDDWKTLAEDKEVWRAYVHAVMNLRVR